MIYCPKFLFLSKEVRDIELRVKIDPQPHKDTDCIVFSWEYLGDEPDKIIWEGLDKNLDLCGKELKCPHKLDEAILIDGKSYYVDDILNMKREDGWYWRFNIKELK